MGLTKWRSLPSATPGGFESLDKSSPCGKLFPSEPIPSVILAVRSESQLLLLVS